MSGKFICQRILTIMPQGPFKSRMLISQIQQFSNMVSVLQP